MEITFPVWQVNSEESKKRRVLEVDSHLLKVKFPETSLLQIWGKKFFKILCFILWMAKVKFLLCCLDFFLLQCSQINTWKCNLLCFQVFLCNSKSNKLASSASPLWQILIFYHIVRSTDTGYILFSHKDN